MNACFAPSKIPQQTGRPIQERIAKVASRIRMRELALQWRREIEAHGPNDITDQLLDLVIAHRNFSRLK